MRHVHIDLAALEQALRKSFAGILEDGKAAARHDNDRFVMDMQHECVDVVVALALTVARWRNDGRALPLISQAVASAIANIISATTSTIGHPSAVPVVLNLLFENLGKLLTEAPGVHGEMRTTQVHVPVQRGGTA